MTRRPSVHPLLFEADAVLFLYGQNLGEVAPSDRRSSGSGATRYATSRVARDALGVVL